MIGPPIEFSPQSRGDRFRSPNIKRGKPFPNTRSIEPDTTKARLIKHSMDVRAPHKTVFSNGSIELFFFRSVRRASFLTQCRMAVANSKAGKFVVHASRDTHMNLIPPDQELTSHEDIFHAGFHLRGALGLLELRLCIQVAESATYPALLDRARIRDCLAEHLIAATNADQFSPAVQ